MTPSQAIVLLAEHFPDRYFSITGEFNSYPKSAHRDQRKTTSDVTVYVENSNGSNYKAANLETAVRMAIDDNIPAKDGTQADAIIAAAEQPEATYPPMEIRDVKFISSAAI